MAMASDALKSEALRLAQSGDTAKAIDKFKALLKEDRDDLDSCVKLAELYVKTGQRHHAVRFYEVAAKRYAARGVLPKAVAISKVILKLDPKRQEIRDLLAKLYGNKEKVAEPAIVEAAPVAPPPEEAPLELELVEEAPETEDEVLLLDELGEDDVLDEVIEGAIEGPAAEKLLAQLPKVPIFSDLAPQEFTWFVHAMEVKLYAAGETILKEGDPGDAFYIITAGQARVTKKSPSGAPIVLATLGEGAFFGEFAYLSGGVRTASVLAESELELLEISRKNMDALIADFPQIKEVMQKFFRERALHTVTMVSPVFAATPKNERDAVLGRMRYIEAAKGKSIITEGEQAKGLFVIAFGEMQVSMKNDWGGEEQLATLQVGDVFGEISLIAKTATSASVTASQKSAVFGLSPNDFNAISAGTPQFVKLLRELAEKRTKHNQQVRDSQMELGEQGLV